MAFCILPLDRPRAFFDRDGRHFSIGVMAQLANGLRLQKETWEKEYAFLRRFVRNVIWIQHRGAVLQQVDGLDWISAGLRYGASDSGLNLFGICCIMQENDNLQCIASLHCETITAVPIQVEMEGKY